MFIKGPKENSHDWLVHIKKAICEIETFTSGISKNDFMDVKLISSAVLFQFSVIGEAIIHIEISILDKYEYPWYKVRAFRNLIAHEYFSIKLDAVWDIIDYDLKKLKQTIDKILEQEF